MKGQLALALANTSNGAPVYVLRAVKHAAGDLELEVRQLPSPATPHVKQAVRLAGLRGAKLALVESRVLRVLGKEGRALALLRSGERRELQLAEDLAVRLVLLFRTLAPMRSREAMSQVAQMVEGLSREEASWWAGKVLHRSRPRRVLAALRLLAGEAG